MAAYLRPSLEGLGAARMKAGSLFSGIGGFDLGLERAGFDIAWQAEIEPFPSKVLAAHWPGVINYGDVRSVGLSGVGVRRAGGNGASAAPAGDLRPALEPGSGSVDLICGGFPCQDLSVAGKRAGLAGVRSGLWFEFHRILSELRPTFCLVENVPGLLSSNGGRDFGVVLAGLGELWPAVGWAVLDSQHFGVAQRRRRVYIIGGPSRASVQQILSLCEGGDWHSQTRREAGEDVAPTLNGSANRTGGDRPPGTQVDTAESLVLSYSASGAGWWGEGLSRLRAQGGGTPENIALVTHSLRADGFDASEDGTGRGTPLVVDPAYQERLQGESGTAYWERMARVEKERGITPEMLARGHEPFSVRTAQAGSNGWGVDESGTAYTLDGANGQAVAGASVRRLTPTECERLQGFPDGWTDIDGARDGPRYKALGNAVTVPVIEYIGRRMIEVLNNVPTTATRTGQRTQVDDCGDEYRSPTGGAKPEKEDQV